MRTAFYDDVDAIDWGPLLPRLYGVAKSIDDLNEQMERSHRHLIQSIDRLKFARAAGVIRRQFQKPLSADEKACCYVMHLMSRSGNPYPIFGRTPQECEGEAKQFAALQTYWKLPKDAKPKPVRQEKSLNRDRQTVAPPPDDPDDSACEACIECEDGGRLCIKGRNRADVERQLRELSEVLPNWFHRARRSIR